MSYRQLPGQADSPSGRPKPVPPEPEHYAGVNFPYRGVQTHGVEPPKDAKYNTREFQYPEEKADEPEAPLPEPDPILVRVVNQHARERRMWRPIRTQATQYATRIVGRNDARTNMRLRNLDTQNAIYIGGDSTVSAYTGYKVSAGAEIYPFNTTEEVWVCTGDSSIVEIAVMYEYGVEL